MNRRGFISLLVGSAGAPLVPWRGLIEPQIFLPPKPRVDLPRYLTSKDVWFLKTSVCTCTSQFCNQLHRYPRGDLCQESLERMLIKIRDAVDARGQRISIRPTHVIYGSSGL